MKRYATIFTRNFETYIASKYAKKITTNVYNHINENIINQLGLSLSFSKSYSDNKYVKYSLCGYIEK